MEYTLPLWSQRPLFICCFPEPSAHPNMIIFTENVSSKRQFVVVKIRAVLTNIFQLTSITKNLNDAHELLTSMKTAAILFFSVDCCH